MPDSDAPTPDIFAVIADPTRRALLALLRDRLDLGETAVAVAELVTATGATRQAVNRHLGLLADAALVVIVDDGPHRTYAFDTTGLEPVEDWLAPFVGLAPRGTAPVATAFSAWSGADAGETIGRTLAERTFQARTAVEDAVDTARKTVTKTVRKRISRAGETR